MLKLVKGEKTKTWNGIMICLILEKCSMYIYIFHINSRYRGVNGTN